MDILSARSFADEELQKLVDDLPECELKTLLINVPGSYEEFIISLYHSAKRYGYEQKLIEHIKTHPDANTSDIFEYEDRHEPHEDTDWCKDEDEELDDEDVQTLLGYISKDELRTMLENVPEADDRFVVSAYLGAKQFHIVPECVDYIKAHPEASADEVLEFVDIRKGVG